MNSQHQAAWEHGDLNEDQYMVVRSKDGGQTWSNPVHVADMEDGTRDFPLNVDGRQTLTNYQVRVRGAAASRRIRTMAGCTSSSWTTVRVSTTSTIR